MKISDFLAKPLSSRTVFVSLLLLGIALCSVNARSAKQQTVSKRFPEGIVTTSARQAESPAFIREATFGITDDAANGTSLGFALNRSVLTNKGDTLITG